MGKRNAKRIAVGVATVVFGLMALGVYQHDTDQIRPEVATDVDQSTSTPRFEPSGRTQSLTAAEHAPVQSTPASFYSNQNASRVTLSGADKRRMGVLAERFNDFTNDMMLNPQAVDVDRLVQADGALASTRKLRVAAYCSSPMYRSMERFTAIVNRTVGRSGLDNEHAEFLANQFDFCQQINHRLGGLNGLALLEDMHRGGLAGDQNARFLYLYALSWFVELESRYAIDQPAEYMQRRDVAFRWHHQLAANGVEPALDFLVAAYWYGRMTPASAATAYFIMRYAERTFGYTPSHFQLYHEQLPQRLRAQQTLRIDKQVERLVP